MAARVLDASAFVELVLRSGAGREVDLHTPASLSPFLRDRVLNQVLFFRGAVG